MYGMLSPPKSYAIATRLSTCLLALRCAVQSNNYFGNGHRLPCKAFIKRSLASLPKLFSMPH